jgi:hypothetical protein
MYLSAFLFQEFCVESIFEIPDLRTYRGLGIVEFTSRPAYAFELGDSVKRSQFDDIHE